MTPDEAQARAIAEEHRESWDDMVAAFAQALAAARAEGEARHADICPLDEVRKERDDLRAILSEIRLLCDNSDVHDAQVRHRVAILAKEQSA